MSASGCCSTAPSPLHLLEVTVISAQDLHRRRFGRRVRAYAVAWADHQAAHRVRTDVDRAGGAAPTWNDRFLFRVDDAFLRSETAAVTVEVRGVRSLAVGGDPVLGLTRIVVSTFLWSSGLVPSHGSSSRKVAALLLRRLRSLRPQGIINVAVSLLDDAHAARTVPLYDALDSPDAFAVKDLVTHRPASSSSSSSSQSSGNNKPAAHVQRQQQGGDGQVSVDHSGRLDPRSAVFEQRKLVQTLQKWKADLSPPREEDCRRSAWSSLSPASCFRRGSGDWGR